MGSGNSSNGSVTINLQCTVSKEGEMQITGTIKGAGLGTGMGKPKERKEKKRVFWSHH